MRSELFCLMIKPINYVFIAVLATLIVLVIGIVSLCFLIIQGMEGCCICKKYA